MLVPLGKAAVAFPGMVTVNATGKFIWELLEQEQTVDSLVAAIMDRYEVSAETARADAKLFLERLISVKAVIK